MKGLENNLSFYEKLTESDKKLVQRLAEIEKEDADRCAHCGGEDCICCEYYLDRQKWKSPEELFPYATKDVPDINSEEFKEFIKDMDYEDWDKEDAYQEFVDSWYEELRDWERDWEYGHYDEY